MDLRSHSKGQDNGGGELIGSGQIKVKQGVQPVSYSQNGLVFEDGSELPADAIILSYVTLSFHFWLLLKLDNSQNRLPYDARDQPRDLRV